MPNKIKSDKQFKFLEAVAHGMKSDKGPSKKIAKKMLSHEGNKKRFAK